MYTIIVPLGMSLNKQNYFDKLLEYLESILPGGQTFQKNITYDEIIVTKCINKQCNHKGILKWAKNRNSILITLKSGGEKNCYIMSHCPLSSDFPFSLKLVLKKYNKNKDKEYITTNIYKRYELQYIKINNDSNFILNTWRIDEDSNDWIYILFNKIPRYLKIRRDFLNLFQ